MQSETDQEYLTFLRKRFLNTLKAVYNKKTNIFLINNRETEAEFISSDIVFETIAVTNLKTPLGLIKNSLIRTSDILSIEFQHDK